MLSASKKMYASTLDSAINGEIKADFIKLDTQGSELDILQGSSEALQSCLGLEIEVEFREMYEAQPLFGDVAKFVQYYGFDFIDFIAFGKWERSRPDGLRTYLGELIHADALFMRSPESCIKMSRTLNDKSLLFRYLGILYVYARYDLMRATLLLAREAELVDNQRFEEIKRIADHLDSRLHKYQSRLNLLSGATAWTDAELRFNVVS